MFALQVYNNDCITVRLVHFTAPPNPPTDLRALLITSSNTLSVAWTQSSSGGSSTPPASYVIFYEATIGEADKRGYGVSASNSQAGIANRNSGRYVVRMVATSTQHPSLPAEATTTNGECQMTARCNVYTVNITVRTTQDIIILLYSTQLLLLLFLRLVLHEQ